jgi:hypothetical protein
LASLRCTRFSIRRSDSRTEVFNRSGVNNRFGK